MQALGVEDTYWTSQNETALHWVTMMTSWAILSLGIWYRCLLYLLNQSDNLWSSILIAIQDKIQSSCIWKIIRKVFWVSQWVLLVDFLPQNSTVNRGTDFYLEIFKKFQSRISNVPCLPGACCWFKIVSPTLCNTTSWPLFGNNLIIFSTAQISL